MSNDTDYKLIFRHPKREYLEQVMNHLIEKKERYEQKKPEKIPLQQHLKDLGLNRPADFVSWGFAFGKITKAGTFQTVEATTWANENSSNVHIAGEDGELASLLNVYTELDISGSYRDEYSAGSVQGYEKIQEQSREEVDAEEAEWGSDDYSEATKTLLNKTYHGPFDLKEARHLIAQGADLNASMNGTCFGGMLADPNWELYKAIPEFLENGMEMRTIQYLHADLARTLAEKYVDFNLGGLFHLDTNTAKILVEEVSKRQPPKDEVFLLDLSLSEVSEKLAKVLAQFPGILGLGLVELDESLAKILGTHQGTLSLGLEELDLKTAQALVAKANEQSCDGLALNLRSLKEVSLDVGKVLASYPGNLVLGLTDLDASLAAALASHKGLLTFNELGCYNGSGVFELDERTAAELGKHHGPLRIPFLRYLSAKSASGLAKNTHGLYFQDLGTWNRQTDAPNEFHDEGGVSYNCNIDNQVLAELMKCTGEVILGIDHLTPEQAEICTSHPGTLWLPYLRRLQPKAACCLAKKAGNLNLSGLEELSDEICEYFSNFPFTLSLENLEKVSPKGLQSLKRLHNAPEPAGICAPALFGMDQTKGAPSTSHKPEEEKERLAALLKIQKSSEQERAPIQDNLNKRLYVGNLCIDAFESDLFDLFGKVAGVQNVEIARDKDENSAGFGFVEMLTVEGANEATKKLHDAKFMGRRLIVNNAQPDEGDSEISPNPDSGTELANLSAQKVVMARKSLAHKIETEKQESRPPKPLASVSGLDYERLRDDLRKEIKAEVLRELQIEPKTGYSENHSADTTPIRSGSAPTNIEVRPKNAGRESPLYRPGSASRYIWLSFPVGLLLSWILLKIILTTPNSQVDPTSSTNTLSPKDQTATVPETTKHSPVTNSLPTTVVEPRPEETTRSTPKLHVVVQGETYWNLARKYYPASTDFNHAIERLRKANPDLDERRLSIGTEVVIPSEENNEELSPEETPEARGAKAAERLAEGREEDSVPDASDNSESNRRKSRLSKIMQRAAWSAPAANEQAQDDDKSF